MKKLISILTVIIMVLELNSIIFANTVEYIRIELTAQNITDEKLSEMIESGEIPQNVNLLCLSFNPITDLTPLESLINLETLRLSNTQITDLTPLSNLTNLGKNMGGINLRDNQITDLSPLANLTHLEWLTLDNNPISDLSPIETLVNLRLEWFKPWDTLLTDEQIEQFKRNVEHNRKHPPFPSFLAAYVRTHPGSEVDIAIDILRYTIGLDVSPAFSVVQVNAGYEPSVDHALHILRWVIGLESVLDDG